MGSRPQTRAETAKPGGLVWTEDKGVKFGKNVTFSDVGDSESRATSAPSEYSNYDLPDQYEAIPGAFSSGQPEEAGLVTDTSKSSGTHDKEVADMSDSQRDKDDRHRDDDRRREEEKRRAEDRSESRTTNDRRPRSPSPRRRSPSPRRADERQGDSSSTSRTTNDRRTRSPSPRRRSPNPRRADKRQGDSSSTSRTTNDRRTRSPSPRRRSPNPRRADKRQGDSSSTSRTTNDRRTRSPSPRRRSPNPRRADERRDDYRSVSRTTEGRRTRSTSTFPAPSRFQPIEQALEELQKEYGLEEGGEVVGWVPCGEYNSRVAVIYDCDGYMMGRIEPGKYHIFDEKTTPNLARESRALRQTRNKDTWRLSKPEYTRDDIRELGLVYYYVPDKYAQRPYAVLVPNNNETYPWTYQEIVWKDGNITLEPRSKLPRLFRESKYRINTALYTRGKQQFLDHQAAQDRQRGRSPSVLPTYNPYSSEMTKRKFTRLREANQSPEETEDEYEDEAIEIPEEEYEDEEQDDRHDRNDRRERDRDERHDRDYQRDRNGRRERDRDERDDRDYQRERDDRDYQRDRSRRSDERNDEEIEGGGTIEREHLAAASRTRLGNKRSLPLRSGLPTPPDSRRGTPATYRSARQERAGSGNSSRRR